jgi:hypothetical protein
MTRPKIYVIQPFLTNASQGVFNLIASAAAKANVDVFRADSIEHGGVTVKSIHGAIQSATLLIADITDANPNVMYEVGFAQAQKKPLILIAVSSRSIPFDLAYFLVLIYDLASPFEFVDRLARTITQALKKPEGFLYPEAAVEREKRQKVFISYSHHDRTYIDRLLIHLKPLEKEGLIDLWVDTRLKAGDRWKKEIERALNRATVAILLVSADFLASDFITDNELPPILRNAEERGARIIPIIVKPCRFMRDKNLRHFQSINDPKDALIGLSEGQQEAYYDAVAAEVEKTLQRG